MYPLLVYFFLFSLPSSPWSLCNSSSHLLLSPFSQAMTNVACQRAISTTMTLLYLGWLNLCFSPYINLVADNIVVAQWEEGHHRTHASTSFDQAWDWLSHCKFPCTWPQKNIHHKSPPHSNLDNQYTSQQWARELCPLVLVACAGKDGQAYPILKCFWVYLKVIHPYWHHV